MAIRSEDSSRALFIHKSRSWVVIAVSILVIFGFSGEQVGGGPSPAIILSASSWTPIGPTQGQFGITGSPGPFGGRIDVAAPDPSNSDVMYLGANVGGIWKTTNWSNSNPTWTEITNLPQILSLAVHEHDLIVFNSNIILAGASGPGGGVLRSDDAGNTWSYLGNSRFDLSEFGAIVVDPNVANAQTLYVAISGGSVSPIQGSGVFKSTDGGTTWTDAGSGTFSGLVTDLLQIQENGITVLYAGDAGNGDVYRSDNGGTSWSPLHLPAGANPWESIRLAGSTVPAEKIYVAAIDNSNHDGLAGVVTRFYTPDQGVNWKTLTWPDATGPDNPGQSHREHHNVLAVDPAHSNIVTVNTDLEGNLQTHRGDGSTFTEWIWQSNDSGQTWLKGPDGGGDPVSGSFDGTGVFVVTSDGGIHLDPINVGANKDGNLNSIEFYGFSLDPNNTRRGYGLFQDGPGVLQYRGVESWVYFGIGQGEAGKIRVGLDPSSSSPRIYDLDPNPTDPVNSPTTAARFVYSDDDGQTWQPAITGLPTVVSYTPTNIVTTDYASFPGKGSIIVDPNNPKRLLLGLAYFKDPSNVVTPGSVFETTTGGDPNTSDPKFNGNGWRNIGSNLAIYNVTISALALAPSAPNTIFAGTEDGRVFKTTNAGNDCNPNCPTWTEVDSGLPTLQKQRVMALQIDPANPDHDFAVTSPFLGRDDKAPDYSGFNHVWMRNGGAWSQINGNLPTKLGGETLAVDWQPATPVLYVGTLRGAYTSTDLGTTWTRLDTLPRTRVTDLDFMPNLHLLGAGTIGWGAWEILTQSTPPAVTPPAGQSAVEGASQSFGLGSFSDPDGGPWMVDIDWGDGAAHAAFNMSSPGSLPNKSHKYGEEGPYTVTIKVTDTLDNSSGSKTFAVNVSDPPVSASGGFSFQVNVNTNTGSQTVATFTDPGGAEPNSFDPNPPTSAGHYATSIDWGDATQSAGSLSPSVPSSPTQQFTVTGNHTYTMESPVNGFNVVTTINHEGVISMATSTAIVGRTGHVQGSGQIGDVHEHRNFDFDAQPDKNKGLKGHMNYRDKTSNIEVDGIAITFVNILSDNVHATIRGTATVNGNSGYNYQLDIEDNGDPGHGNDRFRIRFNGPTSFDSNNVVSDGGLLSTGNIKVNK